MLYRPPPLIGSWENQTGMGTKKKTQSNWGSQGHRGATGAKDVVMKGDVGRQGPRGDADPQGTKGDAGLQGPRSDAGPQGTKGDAGLQGPRSDAGPQGTKGDAGLQGSKGDSSAIDSSRGLTMNGKK